MDVTRRFDAVDDGGAQTQSGPLVLLTDGLFSTSTRHGWLEQELTAGDDGKIRITLCSDEPLPVCGIALYPGVECLSDIASVNLTVGESVLAQELVIGEEEGSPVLLCFDSCQADTLTISLSLREKKTSLRLSEISVLAENTQK